MFPINHYLIAHGKDYQRNYSHDYRSVICECDI